MIPDPMLRDGADRAPIPPDEDPLVKAAESAVCTLLCCEDGQWDGVHPWSAINSARRELERALAARLPSERRTS